MHFSYEEIYFMYGQYDKFVSLNFHFGSEAALKYKSSIMGTFTYIMEEREELEKLRGNELIERADRYVRFEPSELDNLSPDLVELLDREGFKNSDIHTVLSSDLPKTNRYFPQGEKEIENVIIVNFDASDIEDTNLFKFNTYRYRQRAGIPLIENEEAEYLGIGLHYYKAPFAKKYQLKIFNENGVVKRKVRFYQLKSKLTIDTLTEDEDKELEEITSVDMTQRVEVLKKELQRSSERIKELSKEYKTSLMALYRLCAFFEDEVLVARDFPIWWDFERFIHIYIRHVKETKIGERFVGKTIFQYKLKDIRRIIEAVIESVYEDIKVHFGNSDKNFIRMGKRSIYHDGVYYRVEIEPSGRLLTFHPYN